MTRPLSLKLFVSISFLFLALMIVITYSFLSAHFFFRGMDNIVASNLEKTGRSYHQSPAFNSEKTVFNYHRDYTITSDWEALSPDIRQAFKHPPSISNVLYKINNAAWFEHPDIIHFVMRLDFDDGAFFISKTVSAETASAIVGRNIAESMRLLLLISIGITLIMALIIWLILKRVAFPMSQLSQWTHQLDTKTLAQPAPDFLYPELNDMAALIQNSLSSVQQSLEREERFLGYASHELRTPISVIRNNIELLNKLRQAATDINNQKFTQVIDRIDRASLNMKHLSETLLWLSRDITEPLTTQEIDLEKLLININEEMSYLLTNKTIQLTLSTESFSITIAEYPARIILDNLIRNAFQHTSHGQIKIEQKANQIIIINQADPIDSAKKTNDLGFGLGTQLSAQLAEKFNWSYHKQHDANFYCVTITF
jgi:signal transduction histidine kinase